MTKSRIIIDESEWMKLRPEWQELYDQKGVFPFSAPDPVLIWYETTGKLEETTPHIVTLWREERLVGILPLMVTRKRGLRLLRVAGHDVFSGPVIISETEEDRRLLWLAALDSPHYDVAKVKYIEPEKPEHSVFAERSASLCVEDDALFIADFHQGSGAAWLQTLSRHVRAEYKRHKKQLEAIGAFTLRVERGPTFQRDMHEKMLDLKKKWAAEHQKESALFRHDDYLKKLMESSMREGNFLTLSLHDGQTTSAILFCCAVKGVLYAFMSSRDPAWARHSVGIVMMITGCLWAADNGFSSLNMMEGAVDYKARLSNRQIAIKTYFVGKTWKGRAAYLALLLKQKLRRSRFM